MQQPKQVLIIFYRRNSYPCD